MRYLGMMFSRGIPAYFWLGVLYAIFVAYVAALGGEGAVAALTEAPEGAPRDCAVDGSQLYCRVEAALTQEIFPLPLFSGNVFSVTPTVIFIVFGFLAAQA